MYFLSEANKTSGLKLISSFVFITPFLTEDYQRIWTDNMSYNCYMKRVLVFLLYVSCLAPVDSSTPETTSTPETSLRTPDCKNLNVEDSIYMTAPSKGYFGNSIPFKFTFKNYSDEKTSEEGIIASGTILLDEVIIKINYPVDQYIKGSYCNQQIDLTVGNREVTGSIGNQKVNVAIEEGLDNEGNKYIGIIGTVDEQNFSVYNRIIRDGRGVFVGSGSKNFLVVVVAIGYWSDAYENF